MCRRAGNCPVRLRADHRDSAGCEQGDPRDLAFITELTNVVAFDRQIIREELDRKGNPRVQALAADLLAQANGMDAKVKPIAERDGIVPPTDISFHRLADRHARLDAIITTGHYDFDAEFLNDEIASHRRAVADVDRFIHEPSGDPELHVLSTEGIIRLRFNLQRLEALQREYVALR